MRRKVNEMKYLVCETVKHYHMIDIDEELDAESVVNEAFDNVESFDNGVEAVKEELSKYDVLYGFRFDIKPDFGGTETVSMTITEEMD